MDLIGFSFFFQGEHPDAHPLPHRKRGVGGPVQGPSLYSPSEVCYERGRTGK